MPKCRQMESSPSQCDKEAKKSSLPNLPSKTSWDFSRASNIIKRQMVHQASEFKGNQFLALKDTNEADLALKAHGLNMIYILTRYCLHLSLSLSLSPFFSLSFLFLFQ
ncbi:hypothetical protein Ac2012v2_001787 [Leucoagaricus gongylophorus]